MNLKRITIWATVVIAGLGVAYVGYFVIKSARGFLDPTASIKIMREYDSADSQTLLNKITGFYLELDENAVVELSERKEKKLIDPMLKLLNSPFERRQKIALRSLANFDDERIIEPVMQYAEVKRQQGKMDYEYGLALRILSKFKYEKAWPYVLELAQAEDSLSNGSISMLKYFEKPEAVSILNRMQDKIAKGNPVAARAQREQLAEAIKHLESVQKENIAEEGQS